MSAQSTSILSPVLADVPEDGLEVDGQGAFRGARVHGQIVRALAGLILGGGLAPGDPLPNEEELAARFRVSRSSVREAVKTLAAKGLIETRQRVGARVRTRADWRLLDPAVLGWHPDIRKDRGLVDSIVEARRIIEPAAAELAAQRADAGDIARIEAAYLAMEAAAKDDDLFASCEADLALHSGVIEASHNLVLQGLIGTIEATLRASFLATNQWIEGRTISLAAHRRILDAIRACDPAEAREAMSTVLDLADAELHRGRG
ncbi:MAG TPA: FadR/GntR family transcriptional regulator [Lichenihabitans sp.]|jgi:DNA-binding FadR family transcriptional regulator|nr:FadR/GntR family transcriptional regulator [Lichenihabitans sp.]